VETIGVGEGGGVGVGLGVGVGDGVGGDVGPGVPLNWRTRDTRFVVAFRELK
jgi:hypothetical protein